MPEPLNITSASTTTVTLTEREWEIVLSCADCGITDQDNPRAALAAVTKFAAWMESRPWEAVPDDE